MFKFHGEYLRRETSYPLPINSRSLAAQGIPHRAGEVLPNGAVILDEITIRVFDYRRDSIVLALTNSPYTPFVTWVRLVTSDSPVSSGMYVIVDTCAFGNYHSEIEDAVAEFHKRVTEKLDLMGGMAETRQEL